MRVSDPVFADASGVCVEVGKERAGACEREFSDDHQCAAVVVVVPALAGDAVAISWRARAPFLHTDEAFAATGFVPKLLSFPLHRMRMNLQLENKRALVSGSTAGIGFAIAEALAREGAPVIVNGRTQARVDEALKKLKGAKNAEGLAADLGTA